MIGRSRPNRRGSAHGAVWAVLSLVALISASVSSGDVSGGYVSLAKLKLYQIEERPGEDRGVQSVDLGRTFETRLLGCSPSPFGKVTSVNYDLAHDGPVELTLHDASGRLVRRLESGPRAVGRHIVRWDGTDGYGRVVAAGVYFVRFSAGDKVYTGRLTLVR